jgi:hypothetical protein
MGIGARSGTAMSLFAMMLDNLGERLTGSGDGVSLGVDEAFDFEEHFNVTAAVKTLAGSALVGLQLGKLRFPKAEDVSLEVKDARDIANFEVKAVRDGWSGLESAGVKKLSGHRENEEATAIEAGASF